MDRAYRLDDDAERHGTVLIGGSPLKLFRLTEAGAGVVDAIAAGDPVERPHLVTSLLDAGAIHPVTGTARHGVADVTIVVPTLGDPPHPPRGAVVVDDGSNPPVDGASVRLETNRGPGAARNAGLESVTTPLVAFVDADVIVADGWLEALLPHFDDERVGLVAPQVRSTPGSSTIARYESSHSPLDLGGRPARVRAGSRVSYVPAAAVVCRVAAIVEVGGFDERLRFGEDVDLTWRLDAAGWRVRYEPASVVRHAPRPTWRSWFAQRVGYGSSAAPLSRRHPGALAPIRMSGWSLATWVLGVAVHPLAGAAVGAGSAAALVGKLRDVPPRVAFRLAWRGNLHAGDQIALAIRRVWWPFVAVAAWRSRRARWALGLAFLPVRHPVEIADDAAYSVGVWRGMFTERTWAPIVPQLSAWPGRGSRPRSGDDR